MVQAIPESNTISGVDAGFGADTLTPPKEKATPKSKEEFDALAPGTQFVDPEGATRVKPYTPKDEYEFSSIPEGAEFVDPEGNTRKKPTYEGVDFTAQTLYDMALTPKEKKKALERSYPGMVKEGADGFYIDDKGTLRKPGRGISSVTGFAASAAAPTAGAVIGAIGGGAVGAAGGPAGAFVAGTVGAGTGGMLGQGFNDLILGLAGVYDRTPGEEAGNMALSGLTGMAGAGVGRGIATVVPSVKAGVSAVSALAPRAAAHLLGARPDEIKVARELAEQGVMVPPSAVFHESPHLQNMVEVFDPAFRTNKPLRESAVGYYEKKAGEVLDTLGVKREEPLTAPTRDIPTLAAGERIMQRTLAEQAEKDQALQTALEKRAAELQAGLPEKTAQRESLTKAADESRAAAEKLLNQGFKDIEGDADAAMKVAKAGHYSGDLWEGVGAKLRAVRQGISERARYWYDRYDQMTGGAKVSSEELSDTARAMLDELPTEFKSRNPGLVQRLSKLGAVYDEEGQLVKPAEELTYGQLHDLRSLFRGSADWHTLSSDFKNGALKRFSNEIDRLIHDPNAPEHVQAAARFLDMTDKWYGKNIKIFNAKEIETVMKGLEAGEPANPANLYRAVVKEGHTDLIERVKKMVGPNLWSGVKAADTKAMLDASKTLENGVIDARKFAREVLERHRANTLEVVHGKEGAAKLIAQAKAIEQLDGRLTIPAHPTDTMTQVVQRARLAAEAEIAAGKKDPLTALQKEMKDIARQNTEKARQATIARQYRNDPLKFLYDPSTGAMAAVDKILGNEDLILASAARFGENSEEFKLLRHIYVQRVLEKTFNPTERLGKITPEVQQLMFPGITLNQMQTLAKNMQFLTNTRAFKSGEAGASMSAFAKIEHPTILGAGALAGFHFGGPIGAGIGVGTAFVARAMMQKFFAIVTKLATSPATMRFVEKGLNGTPEEREAIRFFTEKVLSKGGALGAGASEATFQGSGE